MNPPFAVEVWKGENLSTNGFSRNVEDDRDAQCAICAYLQRVCELGEGERAVHERFPAAFTPGLCEAHLYWLELEVAQLMGMTEDEVTVTVALEAANQILPLAFTA